MKTRETRENKRKDNPTCAIPCRFHYGIPCRFHLFSADSIMEFHSMRGKKFLKGRKTKTKTKTKTRENKRKQEKHEALKKKGEIRHSFGL